ncbi:MAG: FAD:protein FMN transferase [Clostridia bacterium]|nr:FAD:protein FMN transferase [Clostridia bacterium]
MKSLKKILILPACLAVLVGSALSSGCNKKTYEVYTNIPQGEFEITDKTFKLGGTIGGYSPAEKEKCEEVNTSAYTAKGWTFPSVMYTEAQLVVYADFKEDADKKFEEFTTEEGAKFISFTKAVGQQLDLISKAVSSTVTDSDIYKFNNAAAGATVEISQTTYEILTEALSVYDFTDHYYNPALYYNIKAYGFSTAEQYPQTADELPSDEVIAKYTDLASHFGEIELSNENGYFVTKPAYTVTVEGETLSLKVDLGGIAKGYAVDKVDGLFDEFGYKFGYFNFGASSMLVKRHFKNENFNLEFISPRSVKRDGYFKTSFCNDKLSTSGDNEQRYIIDGVRYCHIIDPTTGKPVQTGIMSATVVGGSAASADALTTAIMAMGKDKAIKFIEEKLTDRKVVFTAE